MNDDSLLVRTAVIGLVSFAAAGLRDAGRLGALLD
jgi:hypothetical protein